MSHPDINTTPYGSPKAVVYPAMLVTLAIGFFLTQPKVARAAEPVRVTHETITLPWHTSMLPNEAPYGAPRFYWTVQTPRRTGCRSLKGVWLENAYLRVLILPEMGGAVGRVIYKPSGEDLFYWEGRIKDYSPYWDSGIKVLFPSTNHCVWTHGQEASHRIVRRKDGSVVVAMMMEFSRFSDVTEKGFNGRYSDMLVTQQVTLAPDRADLQVAYRLINPMPFRQGRKIWTGAYFPRTHTGDGPSHGERRPAQPTETELILPCSYISGHWGRNLRKYDANSGRIGRIRTPDNVYNVLDIPFGFAGAWYPEVKVNRLRITDPGRARGARFYFRGEGTDEKLSDIRKHIYNIIELFGSFDVLSHGCENWIGPGQVRSLSHRYAFVRGIGKVDFANEDAAVNVELATGRIAEVVTLKKVLKLTATWNGKPCGESRSCSPDHPARFEIPGDEEKGTLVLKAGDRKILDREFPLIIPDDTSRHRAIMDAAVQHRVTDPKRFAAVERFGFGNWGGHFSLLARYPPRSVDLGRIEYRAGLLKRAIATLQGAVNDQPEEGEGWHLLGVSLLESGKEKEAHAALAKAIAVARPHEPARYFLALGCLREGDGAAALEHLSKSLAHGPMHWEARLLRGWVAAQDEETRDEAMVALSAMADEDPGDPRVQMALSACADLAGNVDLAGKAGKALQALCTGPGVWRRVREFNAATRGIYKPPQRVTLSPHTLRTRSHSERKAKK